jgi:hypothetical protein
MHHQVSLILPVMGQRGVAQAQVEASEGEEGISQLKIQVGCGHIGSTAGEMSYQHFNSGVG